MAEEGSTSHSAVSPFMSPDAQIKQKAVALTFTNIDHDGKSLDDTEKHAFCRKTRSLSTVLERWTPKSVREETIAWYKQLKEEVDSIKTARSSFTDSQKRAMIAEKEYLYASEVHLQNIRLLMNSPIIEVEAEGELDITDDDAVDVIRGGKRKDDKRIIS